MDYILQKRRATSVEISRAFQTSAANVRHHLAILEDQGLIECVGRIRSTGKGRPACIYHPSYRFAGQNLEMLSSALLEVFRTGDEQPKTDQRLTQLASAMSKLMGVSDEIVLDANSPASGLMPRLSHLMEKLNRCKYEARWEARSGRPQIIFENCPFKPLIEAYPELCFLDSMILAYCLKTPAVQIQKMSTGSSEVQVCRFEIGSTRV
jgi:predicted ArsR family transcriptional regulator